MPLSIMNKDEFRPDAGDMALPPPDWGNFAPLPPRIVTVVKVPAKAKSEPKAKGEPKVGARQNASPRQRVKPRQRPRQAVRPKQKPRVRPNRKEECPRKVLPRFRRRQARLHRRQVLVALSAVFRVADVRSAGADHSCVEGSLLLHSASFALLTA